MRDTDLYAGLLRLNAPWTIEDVVLDAKAGEVRVHVMAAAGSRLPCPKCGAECGVHDRRERTWRHLDSCEFRTLIVARVPRVSCSEHGVHQVHVPWGDPGSRFTAAFEAFAIGWLKEASMAAVARRLQLSWDEAAGIMGRAVARGLKRRALAAPSRISVDETSFQKRHEYVTIVTDGEPDGAVLYVADDRRKKSLEGFFDQFEPADLLRIQSVSMDMWKPYIMATQKFLHEAESKICFDKFHVAQYLSKAIDQTRRSENRDLLADGDRSLVGSKYSWLHRKHEGREKAGRFEALKKSAVRTARAWAIREAAMGLWHYSSRAWAKKAWSKWIGWALRSRLPAVVRVARTVREHLGGIINAIVHRVTNARAESVNARIQRVKRMACGFRNRERFRNAIYFHLGGLNLMPSTHTKP
jgi:transposase